MRILPILVSISIIFPAVIHVPSEQPNIQAGIMWASSGDTVLVAQGVVDMVVGEGVAATWNQGLGDWVGSLQDISVADGYWVSIEPSDSLSSHHFQTVFGECIDCSTVSYSLNTGNNLVSFCCDSNIKPSSVIPEDSSCEYIIGQGLAAQYSQELQTWVGSLEANGMEPGKGYWLNCTEPVDNFKWECE